MVWMSRAGASKELLSQAQAGSHKLLMLSRPYGVDTERRIASIEIEHAGFNDDQCKAYVQEELSDGKLADELLGYIQKHANICSIAHVPVNLQILCALWQDEGHKVREALKQGSLSRFYGRFSQWVWHRYQERAQQGASVQAREQLFDQLGQIALSALKAGQVLIEPGLIEEALTDSKTDAREVKNKCKDAGFLLLQSIEGKFYQSPHITFQEYFAGRWLARLFLEEKRNKVKEWLDAHKYEPQYGRTLSFLAGEVSKQPSEESEEVQHSTLQQLLELLDAGPVELVGVQQTLMQVRLLAEWLCLLKRRADEATLRKAFPVLNKLEG